MTNATPDFVMVQLTARGREIACGAPLIISNGRRSLSFVGTTPVKCERSYEWKGVLMPKTDLAGAPLFELTPTPAAPATPEPAAAAKGPVAVPAAAAAPAASTSK